MEPQHAQLVAADLLIKTWDIFHVITKLCRNSTSVQIPAIAYIQKKAIQFF